MLGARARSFDLNIIIPFISDARGRLLMKDDHRTADLDTYSQTTRPGVHANASKTCSIVLL